MNALAEFLLARIAEDEAAAVEAGADDWEVADQRKVRWVRNGGNAHGWVAIADLSTATAHIARWDPARVLAECALKRGIVAYCTPGDDVTASLVAAMQEGVDPAALDQIRPLLQSFERMVDGALEHVLRTLAFAYADHPDYREEWRP